MSGQANKAGAASGQKVPKPPKSKFRRESEQEKVSRSKLRMDKRGEKLDAAHEKLSKQKPPKKPGPVKRVGRVAGREVHGFVHGKIHQAEDENVDVEGVHRAELTGEAALCGGTRFVKKRIRTHPARAVRNGATRRSFGTFRPKAAGFGEAPQQAFLRPLGL